MVSLRERVLGCMLGGAAGDALGAAVEFMSLDAIRTRFGPSLLAELVPVYGQLGAITDDTQMAMFTAEGLLRARAAGAEDAIPFVHRAYLRWLHTQGFRSEAPDFDDALDGWLVRVPALHDQRAPGNTCLTGLMGATPGRPEAPLNDSKGCGGVMRIAPVGLLLREDEAFDVGNRACALTHGHPSGWRAGGFMAALVARLLDGLPPREAVVGLREAVADELHDELREAIDGAIAAAEVDEPDAHTVESQGEGWVAEEALAIGILCLLVAREPGQGLRLAVNHSGDSDSTGAIAGNLLGAAHGVQALPSGWVQALELREEIEQLALDLLGAREGKSVSLDRYPAR